MRYALVGLAALLATHSAPSEQDATFCPSLKRIVAAAPEKWQSFDAGQTRIGGGQLELPGAHESSATLAGSTGCRILTYKNVTSHSCYFRVESATDAAIMANSIARIVGRCLGKSESLPRESVEGEYRLYTYTAGGLDYVVKVRPSTTISIELNLRPSTPAPSS
jgi:hypothetical protein